jgi:glycosyltransferase involved in cell wall biosynthesis
MESVHAQLIKRLSDRYRFSVVASSVDLDLQELVSWHPVRVPRRPAPLRIAAFAIAAGLQVRRHRTAMDVIHTCGAVVPNRVDVSTVHFCHEGYVDLYRDLAPREMSAGRRMNTSAKRFLAVALERYCYRPCHVRMLLAVSSQIRDELTRHFARVPAVVTPNAVDLGKFAPDADARAALRHQEAVGDAVVALFVGGDWERKGLDVAIEGIARARLAGAPVVLWIVGSGNQERYRRQAGAAGISGAVRFWGRQPDPRAWLTAADVYLGPSTYESFSLAMVEAAACGLPLITTEVGIASELFGAATDGAPGILVPPDAVAIGKALVQLSSDRDLMRQYGKVARQCAQRFTWDNLVGQVDGVYQELLSSRDSALTDA